MTTSPFMPLIADQDLRLPAYFKDDLTSENLMHLLKKIFPRDEVLAYFFDVCRHFLCSGKSHKNAYVFSGFDVKGKNFIIQLLRNIFPSEILSDLKNITSGNKISFIKEDSVKLQSGDIKRITSGDTVFARTLDSPSQTNENVSPTLVFLCEHELQVEGADDALKHRLIYVPFISKEFTGCRDFLTEEMKQFSVSMKWLILQSVSRRSQDFPPPLVQEYVRRLIPLY